MFTMVLLLFAKGDFIMAEKVTIQDIADALGLSRNTVSKAINNTGVLAESTKMKVLEKAKEMGYKQFSFVSIKDAMDAPSRQNREIALLSTSILGSSHFSSTMLDNIHQELSQLGYTLSMHIIRKDEVDALIPPASFNADRTDGILCLETFQADYSHMLCNLGIPILFIDTAANVSELDLHADKLYMDNTTNIHKLVKNLIFRGKKNIGFIGSYMHCQSFFERYMAFRQAMFLFGETCNEDYCIIDSYDHLSRKEYMDMLEKRIDSLEELPDVFICANDFVATDVLQIFRQLNISVPDDVYLCGFDDSPESRIVTPPLTTIHIHSQIMGYTAVQLLLSRIKDPELDYRTVYTQTTLIFRDSTEGE